MNFLDSLFSLAPHLLEGAKTGPSHVMVRCPFHAGGKEKTPSCSISTWKPVFMCFAGETRVLTRNGPRPIRDLAGEEHDVLVPGGYWVKSPFSEFGSQRLWEIELSRNGVKKTIRATGDHRWFLRRQRRDHPIERTTAQLLPKDVLASCFPVSLSSRCDGERPIKPSAFGIARGFVYGDGTALRKGGSIAYLIGEKDAELARYFAQSPSSLQRVQHPKYGEQVRTRVSDLPTYFKTQQPPLDESVSYIYGWLAGYFAADGCVGEDGYAVLHSADRAALEGVRALCTRVGIATTSIKARARRGITGEVLPLYSVGFFTSTLTADFFLISAHRKRFVQHQKAYERRHWQVVSVKRTRAKEPVYCATVPHESHAFTLEDNILTGNCHACKEAGHVSFLLRHFGMSRSVIDAILPREEPYQRQQNTVAARMVKGLDPFRGQFVLDESILDYYRLMPTSLYNAGFTVETLRHFEVGFDNANQRITFPLRNVFGDLVGISGRTIYDSSEGAKYRIYDSELRARTDVHIPDNYSMEEAKKAVLWHGHIVRPLFFLRNKGHDQLIITEGFKACMWTYQAGLEDTVALAGSYLTDVHAELIARATRKVTLMLDNNEAGIKGTHGAGHALLKKGVDVYVARYPDDREQPDSYFPDEVQEMVASKERFADWSARNRMPQSLRHIKKWHTQKYADEYEGSYWQRSEAQ